MVVTDGASEGYKEVFEEYNWKTQGDRKEKWVGKENSPIYSTNLLFL